MENKVIKAKENNQSIPIERSERKVWAIQLANLFRLQSLKLLRSPSMSFAIFGLPLILLFGIGALVPANSLLTPCFGMEAIVVAGIIFGDLHYNMEYSTLNKNASVMNYGHKTRLLSTSIVTLIVTLMAVFVEFAVLISFESMGKFFMSGFVFFGEYHYQTLDILWKNLIWGDIIYYVIVNILLTISLFILVKNFFESNKTFIMFLLVYVLFDILFGGILIMNYNSAIIYENGGKFYSSGILANNGVILGTKKNVWNWTSWYSFTKFITPNYFINQQFSTAFKVGANQTSGIYGWNADGSLWVDWNFETSVSWVREAHTLVLDGKYQEAFTKYVKSQPLNSSFWKPYSNDYSFTLSALLPWIYTIGMGWTGFALTRVQGWIK